MTRKTTIQRFKLDIPARVELETDKMQDGSPAIAVHVYRTDRDHPNSLMISFYYTKKNYDSGGIFGCLNRAITTPIRDIWQKTFGKLYKRRAKHEKK